MYFEYLTAYLLLTIKFINVDSQICQEESANHPNGHQCDQSLHILHPDYDAIRGYCGRTTKDIVTGKVTRAKDAEKGEVPYIGSLVYDRKHQCGVVLIDNMHVITAAHCVVLKAAYNERLLPDQLKVVLGTNVRYDPTRNDPDSHEFEVDTFIHHKGYHRLEYNRFGPFTGNDLAIIRLTRPVKFTSTIWPICLGTSSDELGHVNTNPIMLAGFGRDGIRYKNVLQVSEKLTLITEPECEDELEKISKRFHDGQVCTIPSDPLKGR